MYVLPPSSWSKSEASNKPVKSKSFKLRFDSEDGGSELLRNVGELLLEYNTSHPETWYFFKNSYSSPQRPRQMWART
jgi:hypothetical protein